MDQQKSDQRRCAKCGQRAAGPGGILCPQCRAEIEAAGEQWTNPTGQDPTDS